MVLAVGLLGATGYMGAPICSALTAASRQNQLRLIIFHRPPSDTSRYPKDVERRSLDLEGEVEKLKSCIGDINVLISCVSGSAIPSQLRLLSALKDSPNLITFFPSEWATPNTEEDQSSPYLQGWKKKQEVIDRARELGVPITVVKNASTPELVFGPFGQTVDVKRNSLVVYAPSSGDDERGMTSEAFSGAAVVHLLLNRLSDLPNKTFSIVEQGVSINALRNALEAIHGTPPTIKEYHQADYERDLQAGFMDAMRAAARKWYATGQTWPGERVLVPGWKVRTIEEIAREYM